MCTSDKGPRTTATTAATLLSSSSSDIDKYAVLVEMPFSFILLKMVISPHLKHLKDWPHTRYRQRYFKEILKEVRRKHKFRSSSFPFLQTKVSGTLLIFNGRLNKST
ncbi:hypothetical protein NQD34_013151 [Periophthalmus magnuspinnatus]|nr:hypothetical protein NQD34_013151 [Periophthalmus magnuspinnatus]